MVFLYLFYYFEIMPISGIVHGYMAFVDEIKLHMKAGNGGNGVVRWRQEKGRAYAGAAGGNAGRGGDVYALAVRDIGILSKYRNVKVFAAENGKDGGKKSMHGRDGEDIIVELPVGSIIRNEKFGFDYQLLQDGEKVKLLRGGAGGLGNEHFKGSKNTTPWEFTTGKPGEEAEFSIELQLIVDAGFIGFPNAGKSSLLNALTPAKAKIGSYAFTTLEPNLGTLYTYILADIPGLIEGASEGKGLGYKFLRHVRRTKMLVHCISLENANIAEAYKTIRAELAAYDKALTEKQEILVLTKTDAVTPERVGEAKKELAKASKQKISDICTVSVYDDAALKNLGDHLVKILRSV